MTTQPLKRPARRREGLGGAVTPVAALIIAAGIPLIAGSAYDVGRYELVLLYMLVALGMDLAFGFAGQLTLGQPVMMGAAAYTAGILTAEYHWDAWHTLPLALPIGIGAGLVISAPAVRLRGWYLAVTTFFAAIVFPDVIATASQWTHGSDGLGGIPGLPGLSSPGGTPLPQYELIVGVVALMWWGIHNLATGSWGIVLRGVRDSPSATASCGVNVGLVQALIAGIAAVPVAIAGWLWAYTSQFVAPESFGFGLLILVIASVMLGGRGTLWGPVIGTLVFQAFSLWIGPFSRFNQLILGVALLVVGAMAPEGIIPLAVAAARRTIWKQDEKRRVPEQAGLHTAVDGAAAGPRNPGQPVIQASHIDKAFGGMTVLRNVDVQVPAGVVVGLVGPNGSGKTSLLNVLTGFIQRDAGEVQIRGESVSRSRSYHIARMGVRRSFQVPQLIDELSVLENVELGLLGGRNSIVGSLFRTPAYRRFAREIADRALRACAEVGLDAPVCGTAVGELPLGLKRIVEVARAIVADAKAICLDEPAAGLSGNDLAVVGQTLRRLAQQGYGVLLIEHNLAFVQEYCDQLVLLEGGQVVGHSLAEAQAGNDRLRAFFGDQLVPKTL